MRERVERHVGLPWSAFDVTRLAPSLGVPLLVVHDRGDAEVPWQHGRAVAQVWPGARLVTTDGLGHRRILRDRGVVDEAVAFLTAEAETRRRAEAPGERSMAVMPSGRAPTAQRGRVSANRSRPTVASISRRKTRLT